MLQIDHLKLIQGDPQEMKKMRGLILGLNPGEIKPAIAAHEADHSCCRQEAWDTTVLRIIHALKPATKIVSVNINSPEDAE